jgi:hypothetical protein
MYVEMQLDLEQTTCVLTHRTAVRLDCKHSVLSGASCVDGCCKGLPTLQDDVCDLQQYQYSSEGAPSSQACAYSEWL